MAPSAISFSFAGWSSGTKLSSDMTRRTSGTFSRRAAIFRASASEFVITLMALAPVFGSFRRSRKVAIEFNLRAAQIDRIEVELQEIKQRQAGHRDHQRADDDADAMFFKEVIDRRQEGIADGFLLAGRVEQAQQRRQHRDAGQKCDQHADAGDLAEFGDALVIGRQEREEAGRRRHRRQRKRDRDMFGGLRQRRLQIIVLEALRAVADAELDAEIDAEADEQDRERDR